MESRVGKPMYYLWHKTRPNLIGGIKLRIYRKLYYVQVFFSRSGRVS